MLLLVLSIALLSPASRADTEVRGRVFFPRLDAAKPSFLFLSKVNETGERIRVVNTYSDTAGKLLIEEETEFAGPSLTRYAYKQHQVNDFGSATIENGRVKMSFTEEGETKTEDEPLEPDTVVAPMIGPLLNRRWDDLMKGETIKVRYLAIERLETIGFKFFKDGERTLNGRAVVDVLMKPSSFFIAALVSPVRITLTKEAPHWIVESDGRTAIRWPKRQPPQKRGDWKAIDARVEYDPPASR